MRLASLSAGDQSIGCGMACSARNFKLHTDPCAAEISGHVTLNFDCVRNLGSQNYERPLERVGTAMMAQHRLLCVVFVALISFANASIEPVRGIPKSSMFFVEMK